MTYRDELAEVRAFVRERAAAAGLAGSRVRDLVLAASELAANTLRHTKGNGLVRVWARHGEVICEFRDEGIISDPRAGLARPAITAGSGLGLWVVRQVCDAVDIEPGTSGTIIRLRMRLAGP